MPIWSSFIWHLYALRSALKATRPGYGSSQYPIDTNKNYKINILEGLYNIMKINQINFQHVNPIIML